MFEIFSPPHIWGVPQQIRGVRPLLPPPRSIREDLFCNPDILKSHEPPSQSWLEISGRKRVCRTQLARLRDAKHLPNHSSLKWLTCSGDMLCGICFWAWGTTGGGSPVTQIDVMTEMTISFINVSTTLNWWKSGEYINGQNPQPHTSSHQRYV